MADDAEGRDTVRQLMKRFEFIAAQAGAMAYVLAKRDPHKYARLLVAAEVALKTVTQTISNADRDFIAIYAALDDPRADWSKAVAAMLDRGATEFTGEEAIERFAFLQSLEERFHAEMKDKNKSDGEEESGIGNRG